MGIWGILGAVMILVIVIAVLSVVTAMMFRIVVPTNEVHVVQRKKVTVSYGRGRELGNVYYKWPSWMPRVGVTKLVLPTTNFDIDLKQYEAFDVGRVPFMIDVKAFFQVKDPENAAQRIPNFDELKKQLTDILRGSVRKILGNSEIEEILGGRGRFSIEFTNEVGDQLTAWGVTTVKNIEFMDIKDSPGSTVIENIMAKKKSRIEKESRIEVAQNKQLSKQAEIDAEREVEIRRQEAEKQVGERTAEKDKAIGIAKQKSLQEIKEQEKITAEKELAIKRIQQEQQATIDKNVAVIDSEKIKEQKRLAAEAGLIEQQKSAQGIQVVGQAKAEAEKAMQMAPVQAQIVLAKEIGENQGYQNYLLGVKGYDVELVVGTEKAKALSSGELKVIVNSGDVNSGVNNLMDIFSAKGGTNIGSMLEAAGQTEMGRAVLNKFFPSEEAHPIINN